MSCDRSRPCEDPVRSEARALANMLDTGRQTDQVIRALQEDANIFPPRDMARMGQMISGMERKDRGDNLTVQRDGSMTIDDGRRAVLAVSADDIYGRRPDPRYNRDYGYEQQRNPHANGKDVGTEVLINGGLGAITGAAVRGGKGVLPGALGGVSNVVVDQVAGPKESRSAGADVLLKGVVGYGVGTIAGGKKGGIAGALGSIVPNVGERVIENNNDRR